MKYRSLEYDSSFNHISKVKKVNFNTIVKNIWSPAIMPPNKGAFPTKTRLFKLLKIK